MRKFIQSGGVLLMAMLVITSCKKEVKPLNLNLTSVGNLSLPANNTTVALAPATPASVDFQWSAANAADGDYVLYQIAFDKEGGDFSKPVYKTVSNGGGVETKITLTHKDLNKIANMGGIAASSTGKLKWTVLASKGTNVVASSESRTIQLSRPAGFAEIPVDMYITGSATEGGADITKAVKLKKNEEGVFEIYTSLKAGNYFLTDKPSDAGKKYYVDGGLIKEGSTPVTISADKKYKLTFDFNVATTSSVEIQSVGLWMSAYGSEIGQLNYIGNSTWEIASLPIEFYQFSWGRDERYKFVVHTSAGIHYMGSSRGDNGPPAGQAASYFFLLPVTNDQWANTYKFDPSADRHNVKVDVNFKTDGAYTHTVTTL
ncbi:SusE domain-containing protein [Mucilaginibacter sp. ZT4R22]|uniref:SusE domain-containing protein n=1 Tax=Mucilaginibacter pankratovii TaxID=2772110 RepID=A0ABR7WK34_9SPHI|nr:SusE domain-containing protein [Mucilaginibacter pankratovii]MBD1362685.1 SusE domain-containing protein [Mucilaginibacter pankratovii]